MANLFIGIDVSKDILDISCLESTNLKYLKYDNTTLGLNKMIEYFNKSKKKIYVGLEATSIYHKLAADYLSVAGYNVYELNPYTVFNYKKYKRTYAKTDKIDSLSIVQYLKENYEELPLYTVKTEDEKKLYVILTRINQLNKMKIQEINHKESSLLVDKDTQKHIDFLDKKIKELKKKLNEIIKLKKNKVLKEKINIISKVPGIGFYTAVVILINMSELGKMNRNQVVSLSGMAPFAEDSGKKRGKRRIRGGRKRVRDSLYMPSLTAIRINAHFREVYDRLKQKGKIHNVIRIVIMKKMLIQANTLMKEYYNK